MKKKVSLLNGIESTAKTIGLMAKSTVYYKMKSPQLRGRIARAKAHRHHQGKGKHRHNSPIESRPSYKKHMKIGYKQKSRSARGKIASDLAHNTKGGKGLIAKRPAHKTHLPFW